MTVLTNVPFHTIVGDDPSVSFLSRRDNAPDVQAWYNAHNTTGGKLRLINPCFKSHIDFSAQITNGVPISIDVQGELSMQLFAGELDLFDKISLHGDGGSGANDVAGAANIVGYNNLGSKSEDDRFFATSGGILTGPFYIVLFEDNSLTANFPDTANGQTLTITSGGDGSAVGSYIVLEQGGNVASYGQHSCYALFLGGGVPNPNQTGLHWTFGASSGITGQIPLVGGVFKTMRLSGLSSTTQTAFLSVGLGSAYKKHLYLTGCAQSALNTRYRVFGAENVSTGSVVAYVAHYPVQDNTGYTTPISLPDGNNGLIEYIFVTSAVRMEGTDIGISNFSILGFPGYGIQVDQFRNLTARARITRVSVQTNAYPSFFHTTPLEIQGFEVFVRDSVFTYSVNPSVLVTNYTVQADTALVYFENCLFVGGGIIVQAQGTPIITGSIFVTNSITENLTTPFILHDPRGGHLDEISLRNVGLADQASNIPMVDLLITPNTNFASLISIVRLFGDVATSPVIGANVRPSVFENRSSFTEGLTLPKTHPTATEFVREDAGRVDALSVNAASSFSPVLDFGFNVPIPDPSTWGGLPGGVGTCSVSYPNGFNGPNGTSNVNPTDLFIPILGGSGQRLLEAFPVTTPQVGDYVMVGCWVQSQDPTQIVPLGEFAVNWVSANNRFSQGGTGFNIGDLTGIYVGGHWQYLTSMFKLATTDGLATQLNFFVGTASSINVAVYNYWAKYIPVSSGLTEQEVIRYYRQHSRYQVPGATKGNLAIDKRMKLDWGGRAQLGATTGGGLQISGGATWYSGSGSPNGSVTGNPGDFYLNTAGGAGTTFWVKESGSGTSSGWVSK